MIKLINIPSLFVALTSLIERVRENLNDEIEIIVPDKLSLFMERFLFEQLNISTSFNIKVSTFNRFAKKRVVVDKEKQISKFASIVLTHKILNENVDRFTILKNNFYSFSYAEEIFKTISQLKSSKITPDEMKIFQSSNINLENKIHDLAIIYEEYENGKAGLLDSADVFLMSTFFVKEGNENKTLYFVGFDDFTAIEYGIIEELAKVGEVNIFNYHSKSSNKSIYNDEIYAQLRNIAYINKLNFAVDDEKNTDDNGLKSFLEKNLFAHTQDKYTLSNEVVKIYSGNGVLSEIEYVARDIRRKIIDGGKYNHNGVAIYDLEANENKIKEIFSKYEINYYIDSEFHLNKSVLYKFLCSVFKFNFENLNVVHVIDLINSPFFEMDDDKKVSLVDKLLLVKNRVHISKEFDFGEDFKDESERLSKFLSLITFKKDMDISEFIHMIEDLSVALNFDGMLAELAKGANLQDRILLTKSKDTIFNVLEDVKKFYPEASIDIVFDIFSHIGEVVKINNLPLTLDAVKVLDANNFMEIFDDLYIINCTYENAPSLKNDCGIILDSEIAELNFANKLSPTIKHINSLSKLRLYNTAMLFNDSLNITYSYNPSILIKEMLAKIQVSIDDKKYNLQPFSNFEFDKYIALSMWDYIEFLSKYHQNSEILHEKLVKTKEFKNLSTENLKIYEDMKTISASQLEAYFKCPFYYFLNNVLKIKVRLDDEIQSLDVGNIIHQIMYEYYKHNKDVGDIYDFCVKEIFKYVDKNERLRMNSDSPTLVNLIDECVRVINGLNYIDENSLFVPKYFEYDFNGKDALKLKNISVIGKVDRIDEFESNLRVIDYKSGRVDAGLKELYYGNKLQLFLYCRAMENALKERAVGGFYLPLHNVFTRDVSNTYALKGFYENETNIIHALDKRLNPSEKSDIVNVRMNKDGLAYRTIGNKELKTDELEKLKDYSTIVSEQAVDEIKSGYIEPTPSAVSKPCEYCPYVHVCMRKSNNIKFRPSNKVTLDSFDKD